MTEREAFIAAIAAAPDDDLPRLAFADWLDERGESPRAEFIRLQCQLHHLELELPDFETRHNDPARAPLWERAHALFEAHGREWFSPFCRAMGFDSTQRTQSPRRSLLDRVLRCPVSSWDPWYLDYFGGGAGSLDVIGDACVGSLRFSRGFINGLDLPLHRTRPPRAVAEAFRLEPVDRLTITLDTNVRHWIALEGPHLKQVRSIGLHPQANRDRRQLKTFERLANSDDWSGLREVHMHTLPGGEGLATAASFVSALVASRLMAPVRTLSLCTNAEGLSRIGQGRSLGSVRTLQLVMSHLPPAGGVLRDSPLTRQLESLILSGNDLGDLGVQDLLATEWPHLHTLDLGFNHLADRAAKAIRPIAHRLTELTLAGNEISDRAALELADVLNPATLVALCLSYTPLSEGTVSELRSRFGERFQFVRDVRAHDT